MEQINEDFMESEHLPIILSITKKIKTKLENKCHLNDSIKTRSKIYLGNFNRDLFVSLI